MSDQQRPMRSMETSSPLCPWSMERLFPPNPSYEITIGDMVLSVTPNSALKENQLVVNGKLFILEDPTTPNDEETQ